VEGNGIRDTVSAANLVQQVQFNGLTVGLLNKQHLLNKQYLLGR
jgi:hypothetical protein